LDSAFTVGMAAPLRAQSFIIETADASANALGAYSSIVLDARGNPHVAYHDDTTDDLKFASKQGGAWTRETADGSPNNVGWYASLTLDALGNPHISYWDATSTELEYARRSGGVWVRETVDPSANNLGSHTSIAVDAAGNIHVSYLDVTVGDLKYARKSGGVWTLETADGTGAVTGYWSSLALDASGNPHVSYQDLTNFDLKYARKIGGVWSIETADASPNDVGYYTSLALDAQGNPHVSYQHRTTFDVKYARRTGGLWTIETADASANAVGEYSSLALDAAGNPHIAYEDLTSFDMKYARKNGGAWIVEAADGSAIVAAYPSITIDAAGNPHITYQDETNFDLKYAYIPSLIVSAPGGGATWAVGSEQTVSWSYTGGLGTDVSDLFLSLDGGRTFDLIRDDTRDFSATIRVPHAPTRFAQIKVVQSTPFIAGYSDSFFTIDASIALNKFEARVVADAEVVAEANAVRLTWETTPGPEADIRYRVERAGVVETGAAFTPLHAGLLDANAYLDGGIGATSGVTGGGRYRLIAVNGLGEEYALGETVVAPSLAAGRDIAVSPNPAPGGRARVQYRVPFDSRAGAASVPIDLAVFDVTGRRVTTLAAGAFETGVRSASWDGRDASGREVSAGTYFVRLAWAGSQPVSQRLVVVR